MKTIVGDVAPDMLAFTVGEDPRLDLRLVNADCIGTAAHVTMLSRLRIRPPIITTAECGRVVQELVRIMRLATAGRFRISLADQDVHLAVERVLTVRLGALGRKVHTGRSRNDQVATDLRLFAREQMLAVLAEIVALGSVLAAFSRAHASVPMVGRTHMQPAMPSSVGLWAGAHVESLLDDAAVMVRAYEINDQCPLGAAAGYGVPLPLDRRLVSRLLGFARPVHNVLYANNARGKVESLVLSALAQVMLTLSRLAEDLILFSMPEFGYFRLPAGCTTGSSIMPQKRNPDVLELVRAKASTLFGCLTAVFGLVKGAPSGYNRDLQEAKEPFMRGIETARSCLRVMAAVAQGLGVDRVALRRAFSPEVFATDRALELAAAGVPFRDAYRQVKSGLALLKGLDPAKALAVKRHYGAPAGIERGLVEGRLSEVRRFIRVATGRHNAAVSRLLGVEYPFRS